MRSNALLLSVAGAAADDSADKRLQLSSLIGPLFAWFRTSLHLMEPRNREPRIAVTADRVRSPEARGDVLALLRAADLGITDMERFQPDLDPKAAELLKRAFRIIEGHGEARGDVLALLRAADLGITDMERFQPDLDPKAAELLKRAFRIIEGHGDAPAAHPHAP